jgi:hypothetical protein
VLDNIISRIALDDAALKEIDNPCFGTVQLDKEKEKEKGADHARAKGEFKATLLAASRLRVLSISRILAKFILFYF